MGRYSGYIAAVVIDGRIVKIKAVPSSYEQELGAAKAQRRKAIPLKILFIGRIQPEKLCAFAVQYSPIVARFQVISP